MLQKRWYLKGGEEQIHAANTVRSANPMVGKIPGYGLADFSTQLILVIPFLLTFAAIIHLFKY